MPATVTSPDLPPTASSTDLYFTDLGRVPLLSAVDEVALAITLSRGRAASAQLAAPHAASPSRIKTYPNVNRYRWRTFTQRLTRRSACSVGSGARQQGERRNPRLRAGPLLPPGHEP